METLNYYGYSDGDSSLLSLNIKQNEIDNAQDKKIEELSKQSGGELKICVNPNSYGDHNSLEKEGVLALLNISEEEFDKLMSGEVDKVLFVDESASSRSTTKILKKCLINVYYNSMETIEDDGSIYNEIGVSAFTASNFGFSCGFSTNDGYYLKINGGETPK